MTSQGIYYLIRALVALVAIPFHECGHALVAALQATVCRISSRAESGSGVLPPCSFSHISSTAAAASDAAIPAGTARMA